MGKKASLNAALRYLVLLSLLSRKRSWGTTDLLEALAEHGFDVTLRTVQRDLRELQKLFPHLKSFGPRTQLTWRWDSKAPVMDIPGWDVNLAVAMKLAQSHLKPLLPPQVLADLQPYFNKADTLLAQSGSQLRRWGDKVAVISRTLPLLPPQVDDAVLTEVYSATLNEQPLKIIYRNRENEITEAVFSPAGLVVQEQVIYVVGCFWRYDNIRHLALHRIQSAEVADDADFHLPVGFDFQRYLAQGPFHYPVSDQQLNLRLRMDRLTAKHLQESPLSEDQAILNLPEEPDTVIITATVPDTQQLRWWLLGVGPNVEVLEPLSLRQEIKATIEQMRRHYQEN